MSADPTPSTSPSTSSSGRHPLGTVYLFHFDQRYEHAGHYTGWAEDLDHRVAEHLAGRGARLIEVITQAGIGFRLARTWPGVTRARERQLKRQGGASRHCPICQEDRKARGLPRRPGRDQPRPARTRGHAAASRDQQWAAAVPDPWHPPGTGPGVPGPQPRVRPARAGVAGQAVGWGPQPRRGRAARPPGDQRQPGTRTPSPPSTGSPPSPAGPSRPASKPASNAAPSGPNRPAPTSWPPAPTSGCSPAQAPSGRPSRRPHRAREEQDRER